MQITVPVTSVTFQLNGNGPNFYEITLLSVLVGDLWHGSLDDMTSIDMVDPRSPSIVIHGPDREKRTTEALTQLAARLFPVPV